MTLRLRSGTIALVILSNVMRWTEQEFQPGERIVVAWASLGIVGIAATNYCDVVRTEKHFHGYDAGLGEPQ